MIGFLKDLLFAKNLLPFMRDAADFIGSKAVSMSFWNLCGSKSFIVSSECIIHTVEKYFSQSLLLECWLGPTLWGFFIFFFLSFTQPLCPPSLSLFPSLPGWTSSLESEKTFLCTGNAIISKDSLEFEKTRKGLMQQMDYCLWEKEANPRIKI